jgi:hypothetical protein
MPVHTSRGILRQLDNIFVPLRSFFCANGNVSVDNVVWHMLNLDVSQIVDASGTLVILFENVRMSAQCGCQIPLFTLLFRSDIVVFALD